MTIEARKIRLIMELRQKGIHDTAVMGAIERIPRESFIPEAFHDKAYDDLALPIGQGQTISQPFVVAQMTQMLGLTNRMRVLEIGTGSGYQAAILCQIARRVYSIERHKPLQELALKRLEAMNLRNLTTKVGDGYKGWREAAPFERIIVTCSAQGDLPQPLIDQLAPNGRMVIPVRINALNEQLLIVDKDQDGDISVIEGPAVRFVPLVSEHDMYTPPQAAKETAKQHEESL